jgi:hypothetical protein
MRPASGLLLAPLLVLLASAGTRGQDAFSTGTPAFALTPILPGRDPGPEVVDAVPAGAVTDPLLRPNTATEYHLYVFNKENEPATYIVELRGGPGSSLAAELKVTIPGKKWQRVRLPKPAPPPPPAAAAPAPPPAAPPAKEPPPEPPPPGSKLAANEKGEFQFTLRLLNAADRTPVLDRADPPGNPLGRRVTVNLQRPDEYISTDKEETGAKVATDGALTRVTAQVKAKAAFVGEAPVTLSFPPELPLSGAVIREGFYRRTLVRPPGTDQLPAVILDGAVENAPENLRVFVGVDGYDRAFIYQPSPKGGLTADLIRYDQVGVRLYPAGKFAEKAATAPVAAYPVRVEADNPPVGATLELRLRPVRIPGPPPAGEAAKDELLRRSEVVKLGGARDEQVWLDPSGPGDGGLLVTRRSRDWVWPLDLRHVRGTHEIVAVLSGGGQEVPSLPLVVTIDATAPEDVAFAAFPTRHPKGKPIPITASAVDPDTAVVKATFFVGRPLDDGKLPPDALTVDGVPVDPTDPANREWTANLPVPPERRGEVIVGVVFTNQVGLATTRTARIELVDAPPGGVAAAGVGKIEGTVKILETPQPGLTVVLRNLDGKDLATTTTNAKGKFVFEKVVAGGYTVSSGKKDSSYGYVGSAAVEVKANDTAKPVISMTKAVR